MTNTSFQTPTQKRISPLIHVVNLVALLVIALILVPSAVAKINQLIIILPILIVILLYWNFRTNHTIAALYFGVSLSLVFYIIICENIVTIDNLLGTQMTRKLVLGLRLQAYVDENLRTIDRNYYEPCCNDALTWTHKPGSIYHARYDCAACSAPYEAVVDETGHLNRPRGLWESSDHIDLFLAGDSVTAGMGLPSVLEFVRPQIPATMWNLSVAGHGPRQKINSLLTYALPKHPRWLVVEFFAGNDIQDAIKDELCEETKNFRCSLITPEMQRKLVEHSAYGTMVEISVNDFERFDYYSYNSFTLAITRYIAFGIKHIIKEKLLGSTIQSSLLSQKEFNILPYGIHLKYPADAYFGIREEKLEDWVRAGIALTYKEYERLVIKLANMQPQPIVILLYNPSVYEIYQDLLLDLMPKYDRASAMQKEALRAFSDKHKWRFLDLTLPLRKQLEDHTIWIYGRHDGTHWSLEGTAFVARVMIAELLRIM